jgi:aminoglycoside 6-adenylyltransferase
VTYAVLAARFRAWAAAQADVRGLVVVGSRARGPAADWSDLDLVAFVNTPALYAARRDWLAGLGDLWLAVLDHTGRGDPEWFALYAGGLKVDIVLTRAAPGAAGLPELIAASPYTNVFRRGARGLYAAAGAVELPSAPQPVIAPPPPTLAEFTAAVEGALLSATRVARLLERGDLWRARQQGECDLKQRLIMMLAWRARAESPAGAEAWDDGRRLEQWADARSLAELRAALAVFTADDLWRALLATLRLYRRVARETASRLGYPYPAAADEKVSAWLEARRAGLAGRG